MEAIKVNINEKELKNLVLNKIVSTPQGVIRFENWFDKIILNQKFEGDTDNIKLYMNNKEINIDSILYLLHLNKRFIENHGLVGAKRRVDYILNDLIKLIILESKEKKNEKNRNL